jgi:hypothetical protein
MVQRRGFKRQEPYVYRIVGKILDEAADDWTRAERSMQCRTVTRRM